jgi:hypothetical protein
MSEIAERVSLSGIFASYSRELSETFQATEQALKLPLERGEGREAVLRQFLEGTLPSRYGVGTGFVVNAAGIQSKHIDIVIYDALTCPVFRIGHDPKHDVYPVGGVYGTIEVKSTLTPAKFDEAWNNALSVKEVWKGYAESQRNAAVERPAPALLKANSSASSTIQDSTAHQRRIVLIPPVTACFAYRVQQDWGRPDGKGWQLTAIEKLEAYPWRHSLDLICVHDTGVLTQVFAPNMRSAQGQPEPTKEPQWMLAVGTAFDPFTLFYLHLLIWLSCLMPERIQLMNYFDAAVREREASGDISR